MSLMAGYSNLQLSISWLSKIITHTRALASFNKPSGWLGKESLASSPNNPKGALNLAGILENMSKIFLCLQGVWEGHIYIITSHT